MALSNNSPSRDMVFATVDQVAYAIARGKDGMGDSALMLYRYTRDDETADSDGFTARDFYKAVRARAEVIAIAAGKPLKEQKDKSRDVQIAKLASFPTLGEIARDNLDVDAAMDYAVRLCAGGYTKLVSCAVAMKTGLAKDIHADEATLKDAIDATLVEKAKLASKEVAKIAAAWAKLVHGTDDEPSEFQPQFARLLVAYPADYAETVSANLAFIAKTFAQAEEAAELAILAAKAK
jgi:hypothetical protein